MDLMGLEFDAAGIVSTIATYGLVIIVLLFLGGIGFFIGKYYSFKHDFTIKNITGERMLIEHDKFKLFKDRDGVQWLRLRGRKENLPVPSSECMDLTTKGKRSVTAYFTEDGDFVYSREKYPAGEIRGQVQKGMSHEELFEGNEKVFKKVKKFYLYQQDSNITIESVDPFPSTQRVLLVNQIRKGEEEKGFNWKDQIPLIASMGVLLIIFAMVFVFWEDVTAPSIEVQDKIARQLEAMVDIAQSQRDTALRIQSVVSEDPSRIDIPN